MREKEREKQRERRHAASRSAQRAIEINRDRKIADTRYIISFADPRATAVKSRPNERERMGEEGGERNRSPPFPTMSLVKPGAGLIGGRPLTGVVDTRNDRTDRPGDEFCRAAPRNSFVASNDPGRTGGRGVYLSCTLEFIGTVNSVKAHPSAHARACARASDRSIFSN